MLWGEFVIICHYFALCTYMTKVVAMEETILSAMCSRLRKLSGGGVGVASGVAVGVIIVAVVVIHVLAVLDALGMSSFNHSCNLGTGDRRRYSGIGVSLIARGERSWGLENDEGNKGADVTISN